MIRAIRRKFLEWHLDMLHERWLRCFDRWEESHDHGDTQAACAWRDKADAVAFKARRLEYKVREAGGEP